MTRYGGKVTYTTKSGIVCIADLGFFPTYAEWVEAMAQMLADSTFAPKFWWQVWKTQIIATEVLKRYWELVRERDSTQK